MVRQRGKGYNMRSVKKLMKRGNGPEGPRLEGPRRREKKLAEKRLGEGVDRKGEELKMKRAVGEGGS